MREIAGRFDIGRDNRSGHWVTIIRDYCNPTPTLQNLPVMSKKPTFTLARDSCRCDRSTLLSGRWPVVRRGVLIVHIRSSAETCYGRMILLWCLSLAMAWM